MYMVTRSRRAWRYALALTASVATLAYCAWVGRRWRAPTPSPVDPDGVLARAHAALQADSDLAGIRVAVIAPGILDVSGIVADRTTEARALAVLHAVTGTRRVLNRLVVRPAVAVARSMN
jgi:hypothetical protein